jgi:hypothetical protein
MAVVKQALALARRLRPVQGPVELSGIAEAEGVVRLSRQLAFDEAKGDAEVCRDGRMA